MNKEGKEEKPRNYNLTKYTRTKNKEIKSLPNIQEREQRNYNLTKHSIVEILINSYF